MAQPQPQDSEHDSTVGGIAPIPSLAGAPPAGSPPGAVWLTMCAWCGRLKLRGHWVAAPAAPEVNDRSAAHRPSVTHGICPACFDQATAHTRQGRSARDEP